MICPRCHIEAKVGRVGTSPANRCVNGSFGNPCGETLFPAPKIARGPEREGEVKRRIFRYLATLAPEVYAWPRATGVATYVDAQTRETRTVPFGTPGEADIVACAWGYFLAIEVKSPTGRQQDNQRKYERHVEEACGRYILARGVDDVKLAISDIQVMRARDYEARASR